MYIKLVMHSHTPQVSTGTQHFRWIVDVNQHRTQAKVWSQHCKFALFACRLTGNEDLGKFCLIRGTLYDVLDSIVSVKIRANNLCDVARQTVHNCKHVFDCPWIFACRCLCNVSGWNSECVQNKVVVPTDHSLWIGQRWLSVNDLKLQPTDFPLGRITILHSVGNWLRWRPWSSQQWIRSCDPNCRMPHNSHPFLTRRSRLWCWHRRTWCSCCRRWCFKTWTSPKPFWQISNWLSLSFSLQLLNVLGSSSPNAFPRSPQHRITKWIGVLSFLLRFTSMDRDCVVCGSTLNVRQNILRLSQVVPSNRDYPVHILVILARPRTCLMGNSRLQDTSTELQPVAFAQSPLAVVAEWSLSTTGQDIQLGYQEDACELPLYASLLDLSDLPCGSEGSSGEQRWPQQPWPGTCLSTDSYPSMVLKVALVAYTILRRRSCSCSETKKSSSCVALAVKPVVCLIR